MAYPPPFGSLPTSPRPNPLPAQNDQVAFLLREVERLNRKVEGIDGQAYNPTPLKFFVWLASALTATVVCYLLVPAAWTIWLVNQQPTWPYLQGRMHSTVSNPIFILGVVYASFWEVAILNVVNWRVAIKYPKYRNLVLFPGIFGTVVGPLYVLIYTKTSIPSSPSSDVFNPRPHLSFWPELARILNDIVDMAWKVVVPYTCTIISLAGVALSLIFVTAVRLTKKSSLPGVAQINTLGPFVCNCSN